MPDENPTDFLARLDLDESSRKLGARKPDSVFKAIRIESIRCRAMADKQILNPAIREHFKTIFGRVCQQFLGREEYGYAFPVGVPPTGNPFWGIRREDSLIASPYRPSETVVRWFTFRNNLLFRFMRSDTVAAELDFFFGRSQ